jgi:hypothetical protein
VTDADPDVPDDAVLLAASGWSTTPNARIMANGAVDDLCVVLLEANGAHGAVSYETVELYSRTHDGLWVDDRGGPAGDGLGWHNGDVDLLGRVSRAEIAVADEDRIHRVPVSPTRRWILAARQRELDPHQAPQRIASRDGPRTSAVAPERRACGGVLDGRRPVIGLRR